MFTVPTIVLSIVLQSKGITRNREVTEMLAELSTNYRYLSFHNPNILMINLEA